jgi:molecular chaperone Hsp33
MSKIHRFCSNDFTVRIAAVDATEVVQEVQTLQKIFPIPMMGVGQAMIASALLASQLKEKQQVGLLFRGNGSIKSIYAEAHYEGMVRAYTPFPQYEPPNYNNGFDFTGALGNGTLTVARHQPFQKQPFNGTVELVSSDIAENVAHYLHQSHQTRSIVALGIYLDEYGKVKKAGGMILEIMPGVDENVVLEIQRNIDELQPSISNILMAGGSAISLVDPYMLGIPFTELEHPHAMKYFCPCTRDRVSAALEVLGEADLQDMIDKEETPEIICQMCGKPYKFEVDDIKEIRSLLHKNSMH